MLGTYVTAMKLRKETRFHIRCIRRHQVNGKTKEVSKGLLIRVYITDGDNMHMFNSFTKEMNKNKNSDLGKQAEELKEHLSNLLNKGIENEDYLIIRNTREFSCDKFNLFRFQWFLTVPSIDGLEKIKEEKDTIKYVNAYRNLLMDISNDYLLKEHNIDLILPKPYSNKDVKPNNGFKLKDRVK